MTRNLCCISFKKFLEGLPFDVTADIVMAVPLSDLRGRSPGGLKGCSAFLPFGPEKAFLVLAFTHDPHSREGLGERDYIIT